MYIQLCDRCGATIEGGHGYVEVGGFDKSARIRNNRRVDLCKECYRLLGKFLDGCALEGEPVYNRS